MTHTNLNAYIGATTVKEQIKITYTAEDCEINDKLEDSIKESFKKERAFEKKLIFSGINYQTNTRELIFE